MQFVKKHFLLLFLLSLALVFRLYRLPATQTFLEDEGRDLLIAKRMLDTQRPVLLGPQTSTGNMYLGPFYYYFTTPALFVTGGDPIGPAALIALTGVITVGLLYYLGNLWFGKNAGFFAGLLYAVMPLPVVFTRNSWNPNLVPLVSLLIAWFVVRLIKGEGRQRTNYLVLGGLVGILVQLHYMALLYVAAVGLVLLFALRQQLKALLLGLVWAFAAFVLTLSPFILFEIRNNYVNTQALTSFITASESQNIRYSLPFWLFRDKVGSSAVRLFASLFGRDSLTPDPSRMLIGLVVGIILLVTTWRLRRHPPYLILFALTLIPLFSLGIYQENVHLHYLGFFFPLVYLLFASTRGNRVVGVLLLLYSLPQTLSYLGSGSTNQVIRAREVATYIGERAGSRPYNLVSREGTPTSPYQYFAAKLSNPPTLNPESVLFVVCQGSPCSDADLSSPFIFMTGPAHPSLAAYLGHPLYNYFEGTRKVKSNDHVSHGAWVAELEIIK